MSDYSNLIEEFKKIMFYDKMSFDVFFSMSEHVFSSFDEMEEDLCPVLYKILYRAYYNTESCTIDYTHNDTNYEVNIKVDWNSKVTITNTIRN